MSPFLGIAVSIMCSICAQLLLKYGMARIASSGVENGKSWLIRVTTSPYVIAGLAVYGLGVLFWIFALSQLELSYVYPFGTLSYIGIILASYFLFKERISRVRLLGIAVIIFGLLIITQS